MRGACGAQRPTFMASVAESVVEYVGLLLTSETCERDTWNHRADVAWMTTEP